MKVSAAVCRAQEAIQKDLAINAPLENRRVIAARAAKFWASEALQAEWRESGRKGIMTDLDKTITAEFAEETDTKVDPRAD